MLTYIINNIFQDALLKARICGRNVIESKYIEETLNNFAVDSVFGAPSNPNWVPFGDQNLLYLDVNMRFLCL